MILQDEYIAKETFTFPLFALFAWLLSSIGAALMDKHYK